MPIDPVPIDPAASRRVSAAPAAAAAVLALAALVALAAGQAGDDALSAPEALLLGVVEGITEYLPVSSTGHLTVTQRLLGLGEHGTKGAVDAYAICIQAGAIVAVLGLYRERISGVVLGVLARRRESLPLAAALIAGFLPAAAAGALLGDAVKERLFGVGPVVAAWLVGGAVLLVVAPRVAAGAAGRALEQIAARDGLLIGFGQMLSLWPGVSRSLVTILAAVAVGLSLSAAVEFSFLLGLLTLGAATVYEAAQSGGLIVEQFGVLNPLLGFLMALASAAVAVRWMVSYLQSRSLAVFGWYRIAVALAALALLGAGWV
ncbi:MAG: undecaprenyl-diphosphate phosphatase [Acidimicrobiales bacterium]